jgi:hypothetical protein
MDSKSLGAYKRAKPFRPFVIHTSLGEAYTVAHPENFAFSPDTPVAVLFGGPEGVTMIDLASVTEVTYPVKRTRKEK